MKERNDKKIHVWLVEDHAMFRNGVQRGLDSLPDIECAMCFSTAEEAIEALARHAPPDVVLLDVQLPGMDGIAALQEIKTRAPEARVVILTVFDDADKIFRAVCAGAMGYVLKSAGIEQIGESIRQVMAGGSPMTPGVARKVLDAFARIGPVGTGDAEYNLTNREREVLALMADGMVKKEIADRTGLSIHTVSSHIRNIYEKLHVTTNTAAVAKALRKGLI